MFLIFGCLLFSLFLYADDTFCRTDIAKFCQKMSKTEVSKQDVQCLFQNRKKLSEKCLTEVPAIASKFGACYLELISFCPDRKDDEIGSNYKCLLETKKKHLKPCLTLINNLQEEKKKKVESTINQIAQKCETEYKQCGNPKDFNARNCLIELYKSNKVGPECKKQIDSEMEKKVNSRKPKNI